jgi:hypothetical protein
LVLAAVSTPAELSFLAPLGFSGLLEPDELDDLSLFSFLFEFSDEDLLDEDDDDDEEEEEEEDEDEEDKSTELSEPLSLPFLAALELELALSLAMSALSFSSELCLFRSLGWVCWVIFRLADGG